MPVYLKFKFYLASCILSGNPVAMLFVYSPLLVFKSSFLRKGKQKAIYILSMVFFTYFIKIMKAAYLNGALGTFLKKHHISLMLHKDVY